LLISGGIQGVFDVEQLVDLLQSEGAVDLCVIKLPIELKYAEHLVIVTGRSARHRKALAQLVRRVFKKKSLPSEHIPRIEGAHSDGTNFDWLAMDLGIVFNLDKYSVASN
jgi:ribosomal silencing factor RsfS